MVQIVSEWGLHGVQTLRDRVAVLVIVDVLSFSTAVDVAVGRGAAVRPFPYGDPLAAEAEAARRGCVAATSHRPASGGFSLSPASLAGVPPGLELLLPSPNGSRLSLEGGTTPILTGCLRNAAAAASAVRAIAGDGQIGVIPAGERWPDGSLRPAVEDLLGAGAIIDRLGLPASPEAQVARGAWRAAEPRLADLIRGCLSGRELIERGFPEDVELALQVDVSAAAPRLRDGAYRPEPCDLSSEQA